MTPGDDKWIRSIKDNPAGKVVADPEGNRWEWERTDQDETWRLLRKLNNDELAIEQTDIVNTPRGVHGAGKAGALSERRRSKPLTKPRTGNVGGGFNPYDHSGKPRRR
jgi:hypothetical protein